MNKRLLGTLFFVLTSLCFVPSSFAADPAQTEKIAHEIFQEIFSPFCPGRALEDCPSSSASDLRRDIESKLESGQSKEDVMQQLYAKYGEGISGVPRYVGFGRAAWLLPILFLMLGGIIWAFWIRSRQRLNVSESEEELSSELKEAVQREISASLND